MLKDPQVICAHLCLKVLLKITYQIDDLVRCPGIGSCKDQVLLVNLSYEDVRIIVFGYLGSKQSFNHLPWATNNL